MRDGRIGYRDGVVPESESGPEAPRKSEPIVTPVTLQFLSLYLYIYIYIYIYISHSYYIYIYINISYSYYNTIIRDERGGPRHTVTARPN